MRRLHLIEIEDQRWCPKVIRDAATDYLRYIENLTNPYQPAVPLLRRALERAGTNRVIDLGSGGGGSWLRLSRTLEEAGCTVEVCLTDKYPNTEAFERARSLSGGRISFHPHPVDATQVPGELEGFRTLFSSFHHLRPRDARAVLADAVRSRQGVGVFEVTQRRPLVILMMSLPTLLVLVLTPFIRPFRWARLLWTYLLPVVPAVVLFDGVVSCLRTYTPVELRELTAKLADDGYAWEIGEERIKRSPIPMTYLIGYPIESRQSR